MSNPTIAPVDKLSRDMLKALKNATLGHVGGVTKHEARYLVDLYYDIQKIRVMTNNKVKGILRDAAKNNTHPEPHEAISFVLDQFEALEANVGEILKVYSKTHPMAWFFDQTVGIGPVLSSGLLAHIDIHRCPTAGHIWSFAGLNPDVKWRKGQKRPWNARLKTICWLAGESFVKVSGNERDVYGKMYVSRKILEWERNISGGNQEAAAAALAEKNYRDGTDAKAWYSGQCCPEKARKMLAAGKTPTAADCKTDKGLPMLPPAQINARAKRYAVKIFLSHLHQRWYEQEVGGPAPKPFVIEHMGHVHKIEPPQVPPTKGEEK